jgi:hypothetical protein
MSNVFGSSDYGTTTNVLGLSSGSDKLTKGGDTDALTLTAGTNDGNKFSLVANGTEVLALNAARTATFSGSGGSVTLDPAGLSGASTLKWISLLESKTAADYGAVGDGVVNDSAAVSAALNTSNAQIVFPAGTYRLNTLVTMAATNLCVRGLGRATKFTSATLVNLIRMTTSCTDVVFSDMEFNVTTVAPAEDFYGLIFCNDAAVTRITFQRCYFTCATANVNALKFINEGSNVTDRVRVVDCTFVDVGRMGLETQNHVGLATVRYKGVVVQGCQFERMGKALSYGMGVSFSGVGAQCHVANNVFVDCQIGIEVVGTCDSTFAFNKFRAAGANPFASFKSLSFTNGTGYTAARNRVIGNSCDSPMTAESSFYLQQNLLMQGNFLWHTNTVNNSAYVYFRNCVNTRVVGDHYVTSAGFCVFVESVAGTSTNTTLSHCTLDNSAATTNNLSILRFSGATTTENRVYNCYFVRGATFAGNFLASASSAQAPEVVSCTSNLGLKNFGSAQMIGGYDGASASGGSITFGITKFAAAAGNSVTFTVQTFDANAASLYPGVISIDVASDMFSGTSLVANTFSYGSARIFFTFSNTATSNVTVDLGTLSTLTIGATNSGRTVVITVTNTGAGVGVASTGTNLQFAARIAAAGSSVGPLTVT